MKCNFIKKCIYLEGFTNFDTLINSIRVVYILSFVFNTDIIAINKAIMITTVFIFEIPSGFFSDKYGDKNTFLLSKIFSIASLLIIILFRNEIGVIVSFIMLGLSGSFESGARNSYYRRLCKAYNIDYKRIKINISQKSNILKLFLSVFSSILFSYSMYLPFFITLIMYVVSFISLILLPSNVESVYTKDEKLISSTKNIFNEIVSDYKFFTEILVYTIITSLLIFCFDYYQLFFKSFDIPVYLFGSIYATFKFLSYYGVSIYKKNFDKNISILIIAFSFFLIWVKNMYLFILAVILQQIFYSFENTKFDIFLIEKLEHENKGAHFESIISLIYSLFRIFVVALIAMILKYLNLYIIFLCCSFILVVLFFIRKIILTR